MTSSGHLWGCEGVTFILGPEKHTHITLNTMTLGWLCLNYTAMSLFLNLSFLTGPSTVLFLSPHSNEETPPPSSPAPPPSTCHLILMRKLLPPSSPAPPPSTCHLILMRRLLPPSSPAPPPSTCHLILMRRLLPPSSPAPPPCFALSDARLNFILIFIS